MISTDCLINNSFLKEFDISLSVYYVTLQLIPENSISNSIKSRRL